jgi:glyoxylase-like metal-dependent hydrolase (beta-lactamase superfamily II)
MRKIKPAIFYEDGYKGVTLGAVLSPDHTLLIDAPLRPEDGRAWLDSLAAAGASRKRSLVCLDAHPDRTLGAQALEADTLAQVEVARHVGRRAAVFKTQAQEHGSEWEITPGLTGLRFALPRLTFSATMQLHLDGLLALVEPHAGPGPGASWLALPQAEVVFVGDALTLGEPPFLAQADIPAWLEQLELLQSRAYKNFTVVAGRGGKAEGRDIKQMHSLLKDLQVKLRSLSRSKNRVAEIDKLAVRYAERYKPSARLRTQYVQRLRFGMQEYVERQAGARRS